MLVLLYITGGVFGFFFLSLIGLIGLDYVTVIQDPGWQMLYGFVFHWFFAVPLVIEYYHKNKQHFQSI